MSLFSKRVLPLTLLGAAAVLGGCIGEASLEGDDEQETQPDAADPESAESIDPNAAEAIDPDAAEAVGTAQQELEVAKKWYCMWGVFHHATVTFSEYKSEYDALTACNNISSLCRATGCWVAASNPTYL
ncbi:hypothetical protein [Sorangium sp. So ce887]|uniref:hypothetical protein n=1 Tax=Sorangium sp. So ce887 TaxID=3133324 RepID=UPI003F6137E8